MIMKDFEDIRYNMNYTLFNMRNYGLPQDRQRILIYGIRNDLSVNMSLSNVLHLENKYNKDILKYSLENAIQIQSEYILDIIPEEQYLSSVSNDYPIGNPPTNLIKCYDNLHFSFKKRSKPHFSCVIDKDDVSRTILSTYGRMPRLFVPIKNRNGKYVRPYTVRELQLIQGFSEDFVFKGNHLNQVKQIGNAIPPLFVTHIMEYIKEILNGTII